MNHLFFGLNPVSLSHAPYWPVVQDSLFVRAGDPGYGLKLHPLAPVRWLPNIAGFVGSDALGVILATELHKTDKTRLAIDVGTNGEISAVHNGKLLTCSTPAGPAFEGARISCGMRGTIGAIERVWIDDDVRIKVIGRVKAQGICGSGLIDAVAEMVKAGVVDITGRMITREKAEQKLPPKLAKRVLDTPEGPAFELARGVVLTQRDIRELQLAKGAIASGVAILMKDLGITADDLDCVFMAGAFGNYVNPESAKRIGMVPNVPTERIIGVGNAAGAAAQMALLSLDKREEAMKILDQAIFVELSAREDFADEFMNSMYFPQID
ncbi:MAG TPA: ASKHA domain-containing protein, partial [Chloroflexota bacterium]